MRTGDIVAHKRTKRLYYVEDARYRYSVICSRIGMPNSTLLYFHKEDLEPIEVKKISVSERVVIGLLKGHSTIDIVHKKYDSIVGKCYVKLYHGTSYVICKVEISRIIETFKYEYFEYKVPVLKIKVVDEIIDFDDKKIEYRHNSNFYEQLTKLPYAKKKERWPR